MYREKINNFLAATESNPQIGSMCRNGIKNMFDSVIYYVNIVYNMETRMQIAEFRGIECDKYRAWVSDMDRSRCNAHNAHEAVIANVTMLNKMAEELGIEPVFDGDIKDRNAVGDFCGALVFEYFDNRTQNRVIKPQEFQEKVEAKFHER